MVDRRTEILETARTILLEEGYDALTARRIAERIDITDAGVHYHFDTKDDLLVALVEHLTDEVRREVENLDGPPGDVVAAILRDRFEAARRLREAELPPPSTQLLSATTASGDPFREALREYAETYVEALSGAIRRGIEAGTFEEVPPERTARTLVALIDGAEARASIDRSPDPVAWGVERFVLSELYVEDPPSMEGGA